jgi:hypothetical protein
MRLAAMIETIHHLKQPFLSDLRFVQFERGGEIIIRLTQDLEVMTRYGKKTVKAGFESDGASIPRFAQAIIGHPFDKQYLAQAVNHDDDYRNPQTKLNRYQADVVFRDLLWNTRVPAWKIPLFFSAVRAGGWRYYQSGKI